MSKIYVLKSCPSNYQAKRRRESFLQSLGQPEFLVSYIDRLRLVYDIRFLRLALSDILFVLKRFKCFDGIPYDTGRHVFILDLGDYRKLLLKLSQVYYHGDVHSIKFSLLFLQDCIRGSVKC